MKRHARAISVPLACLAAGFILAVSCARTPAGQPAPATQPEHPMPYRILWTWDSWLCDSENADSYVSEYKALIDFMAEWDYNGVIIWGFLDDAHGGEKAAAEICTYAAGKGVRVLPGVGAGGYEGFHMTRGHKYNLPTFLKARPDLRAVTRSTNSPSGEWMCLYQPDAQKWLADGSKWLAENFRIGGVNIETNESDNIDVCEHAAAAIKAEPSRLRYAASFYDLSVAVPVIYEQVRARHPDAWITYATYQPPWWQRKADGALLAKIPSPAIAQWNMEMSVNTTDKPPVANNVSLIHSGGWSYHLYAFPRKWAFTQYRCFNPDIEQARRFAASQHAMGMEGFVIGNAGSPKMPDNEIAYIAYAEFARDPKLTVEAFSKKFIARLYGEKAEPLVLRLMLAAPDVNSRTSSLWRPWASLMFFGRRPDRLPVATEAQVAALDGQIALARQAREAASDGGKRRLDTILAVLGEYRAIAVLSRHPDLAALAASGRNLPADEYRAAIARLKELAKDAALPDEIYQYSKLR